MQRLKETELRKANRMVGVHCQYLFQIVENIYMLFAGWEVRIVKNCDQGLENAARGRIFKPEVIVFHYTDRP